MIAHYNNYYKNYIYTVHSVLSTKCASHETNTNIFSTILTKTMLILIVSLIVMGTVIQGPGPSQSKRVGT